MTNEALLDPRAWRDVGPFLSGLEGARGPIDARIHPADEMFLYERSLPYRSREAAAINYFNTGSQIARTVEDVVTWRFGGFDRVRSFLDFASGYGRFTRFLVRGLAPEKISVAEIDPGGVRFQEAAFGVRGIVSGSSPAQLLLEGSFDVVFASSFFSHLPAASFEVWLARLQSALAPGGILIFSVHGMHLLPAPEADAASGIVFRPVSETERLDGAEYGTSWVTPEFVLSVADRVGGGGKLLCFPVGLGGFQDLYVLLRPPAPSLPELRLPRFPRGGVDYSAIAEDGTVSVRGWAEGDLGERSPHMRLFFRDSVAGFLPGETGSGSWRLWSFEFPLSAVSPDDVLRVEAESSRGLSSILVLATTRPYLPESRL